MFPEPIKWFSLFIQRDISNSYTRQWVFRRWWKQYCPIWLSNEDRILVLLSLNGVSGPGNQKQPCTFNYLRWPIPICSLVRLCPVGIAPELFYKNSELYTNIHAVSQGQMTQLDLGWLQGHKTGTNGSLCAPSLSLKMSLSCVLLVGNTTSLKVGHLFPSSSSYLPWLGY